MQPQLKPPKPRLGDLLVREGLITQAQLEEALVYQAQHDRKLGEALKELKILPEERLQRFLASQRQKVRIGDVLVKSGLITPDQLAQAAAEQKKSGHKLGEALIYLGFITRKKFLGALSGMLGVPFVDLETYPLQEGIPKRLPEKVARRCQALPLVNSREGLLVGMADPTDIFAFDEVAKTLKLPFRVVLVADDLLKKLLDQIHAPPVVPKPPAPGLDPVVVVQVPAAGVAKGKPLDPPPRVVPARELARTMPQALPASAPEPSRAKAAPPGAAGPVAAPPRKKKRLGDMLVEGGKITLDQLKTALSYQKEKDVKLGEALEALGYITDREIQRFLTEQRRKVRIGDALVEAGVISQEQLMKALAEQKKTGKKLGQTLAYLGILSEQEFLGRLAEQLDLPFVDLRNVQFQPDVINRIPESYARRFRALAIADSSEGLLVGMAEPNDIFVFDELTRLLKAPPRMALVSEADLLRTLDRVYRRTQEIREHAEALGEELEQSAAFSLDQIVQSEMAVDAPVVKILQSLFEDAIQVNASDIHIEPDEDVLRIRQRIDGVLHEQVVKEKQIAPALVSKLKLMAGLEIAEKRLPQDGRFNMSVKGRSVDVRLSTLPIQDGESVVMRLLDQSSGNLNLDMVGMDPRLLKRFRYMIHRPHGLVLVTGPTGSGKTTTLYGALNALNDPGRKIITVEDPVEYRLPRVNQVQIHAKIGLTFASVLRTVLRQDPDVVLVGEMRDQETSEIAVRAALTGHMVLSTLHTNDAVSTAIRLVDMGVESFAVASALRCILAQRLVRRVCTDCRAPHQLDEQEAILVRGMIGDRADRIQLVKGRGCPNCNNTGNRGRIAVIEMLEVKGDLATLLSRNDTAGFMEAAQRQKGFVPLHLAAMEYAIDGIISLEEVLRLTTEMDEEKEDEEGKDDVLEKGPLPAPGPGAAALAASS
ncbi:MAG: Flp pilus assembly complex ATPase component TadA [Magnetococcales bacterium]|nr:Flp pilus assembly complex ATPase component TadA [Magnetococcales bacterium]